MGEANSRVPHNRQLMGTNRQLAASYTEDAGEASDVVVSWECVQQDALMHFVH